MPIRGLTHLHHLEFVRNTLGPHLNLFIYSGGVAQPSKCATLRIFVFVVFGVQQQFCLGWKLLSGEGKAAEGFTELPPPPPPSHTHRVLWEAGVWCLGVAGRLRE